MIELLLFAAQIADVSVRSVALPARPDKPVLVQCPVDQPTRIVLPERLARVTASAGAKAALGIAIERYAPEGVVVVHPKSHPASGRLDVRGPTMQIALQIESVASGAASTIRLVLPQPAPEAASAVGASSSSPADTKISTTSPLAPPPTASLAPLAQLDDQRTVVAGESVPSSSSAVPAVATGQDEFELMSEADHVAIGRREGLPGQKEIVLVDALRSPDWLWLRFVVRGGASEQIAQVALGERELTSFVARSEARDLRVTVKLARAEVGRKARVSLALASGARYTFPLTSSSFTAFVRGLFK